MTHVSSRLPETSVAPGDPLNVIVARYPQALAVFQRFGLDTCCGGALPLETAAAHHNLNLEEVLAALRDAIEAPAR